MMKGPASFSQGLSRGRDAPEADAYFRSCLARHDHAPDLVGGIHCLLIDPVRLADLIEMSVVDDTRSPSRPVLSSVG
jgi:hypothetical protein